MFALAAKLTGWKIDIKSDEEKRAEIEDQMAQMAARTPLTGLPSLSESIVRNSTNSGISTIEDLADTPVAETNQHQGVGPEIAEKIIASVKDYYMQAAETSSAESETQRLKLQLKKSVQDVKADAAQEQEVALPEEAVKETQESLTTSTEPDTEPDHEIKNDE